MNAPCPKRHHSPHFNGKTYSCPDCEANVQPSPLARLHADLERRNKQGDAA